LWPETVQALQVVIANRRTARHDADKDLVFLTRCGLKWVRFELTETKKLGKPVIKTISDNAITKEFSKLLKQLGLKRRGIGFYTLRHCFETVGGGAKDQVAVDAIMGHSDATMASHYRHGIEDERLLAVTNFVRKWLDFPNENA
jgi:integrase